jgi:hypothetical protein
MPALRAVTKRLCSAQLSPLCLLRRMDVLAEKLVPWEPMDHAQRVALLAKRTAVRVH